MPVSERDAQRAIYEPVLMELAARMENIEYRQIFLDLCGSDVCPLFDGDTLLYRDGDHLSWQGALALKDDAAVLFDAQ